MGKIISNFILLSIIFCLASSCGKNEVDRKITPDFAEKIQKYDRLFGFKDGVALVEGENGFGVIDIDGNEIVPCNYMMACAYQNGYFGFIGTDVEEEGSSDDCDYIMFFDKEGKRYKDKFPIGKWYEEDSYGAEIGLGVASGLFDPYRGDIFGFEDGLCRIDTYEGRTFINSEGKKIDHDETLYPDDPHAIINEEMEDVHLFIESGTDAYGHPVPVKGYKKSNGDIIVPARYISIGEFHNGLALVEISIKVPNPNGCAAEMGGRTEYGYVDKYGNSTFPEEILNSVGL